MHVVFAFQFLHHWSHAAAVEHAARRTFEVAGFEFGAGIYVNYAFTLLWIADVILWWRRSLAGKPIAPVYYWVVQAIFGFMMFNATVVFGPAFWKWVAALALVAIIVLRMLLPRAPGLRIGNRDSQVGQAVPAVRVRRSSSAGTTRPTATARMEIIDAYAHCGLSKYEPIEKVRAAMSAGGVSRAVLVQHLGEFDNSYIGSVVASDPEQFAGVLLVDHRTENVADTLTQLVASGTFSRIAADGRGLAGQSGSLFARRRPGIGDCAVRPAGNSSHSVTASQGARKRTAHPPGDHALGEPELNRLAIGRRGEPSVLELARFPNVYLQISGMKMFCPYPHEPLYPLIARRGRRLRSEPTSLGLELSRCGNCRGLHGRPAAVARRPPARSARSDRQGCGGERQAVVVQSRMRQRCATAHP